MERGLFWLPLLLLFSWLAWAGWNEYQKVEAYRLWAEEFERSKYDIYAVLGIKNGELTWGKPTRSSPKDIQTFPLTKVSAITLIANLPKGGASLEFKFQDNANIIKIPFTELSLAQQWEEYLQNLLPIQS
ncbi:MAG: hypothetical protein EA365_04535 [Gloeocapsa sp. DLM2.Bin57]|nr:MAG: hypothetical protein EA365_04535 [Gloeocapsa sp. DLM2.Bin57]